MPHGCTAANKRPVSDSCYNRGFLLWHQPHYPDFLLHEWKSQPFWPPLVTPADEHLTEEALYLLLGFLLHFSPQQEWEMRWRPPKLISWGLPSSSPHVAHVSVSSAACQGSHWLLPPGWAVSACARAGVLGALLRGAPWSPGSRSKQGGPSRGEPRASFLGEQLFWETNAPGISLA